MIEVREVSKSFEKVRALDRVSLRVGAGERVAFVGPNGSGKTTLLRAILGLIRVEGKVTIDGVDVARSPERALMKVAYIPQVAPPLEAPVSELLRAWSGLRRRDVDAVIARGTVLGIDVGLRMTTRFRDLSGGMKQKLLAAMALASGADVLVCDEPTANLDAAARAAFFGAVNELPADTTVVLCSHRDEEVRSLVGRVVELQEGRVSADCPVVEAAIVLERMLRVAS